MKIIKWSSIGKSQSNNVGQSANISQLISEFVKRFAHENALFRILEHWSTLPADEPFFSRTTITTISQQRLPVSNEIGTAVSYGY